MATTLRLPRLAALLAFLSLSVIAAAPAGAGSFDSGGVRLRYVARGIGEPVVLLHGYASGIEHGWRRSGVLGGLADAGFRAIALEQRGHGASGKPHAASYGLEMVEDVRRLLEHLGIDRTHLVGYSMGALIANRFRDRYPAKLLSVTLAGFGELQPGIPLTVTREFADEVAANLRKLALAEENDSRALAWLAVQWREWRVSDGDLKTNQVPTLALVGEEDPFLADTRKLAATMPQVTLRLVPGDHRQAPSRPRFLAELLGFIRAHQRRSGSR